MHIYGPAHLHGPQPIGPPHSSRAPRPAAAPESSAPIRDELDLSNSAQLIDRAKAAPDVRQDRVNAIREQIATGTYETEEKLQIALERFLDEIG
ncbi:MAG: flagellar biosynthesis anti-sigma factor FlgM [Pirellulales bacterium]|nr:flagellar biosynthesis anti-sigma factor FlgM [Pirellulales bacterium]